MSKSHQPTAWISLRRSSKEQLGPYVSRLDRAPSWRELLSRSTSADWTIRINNDRHDYSRLLGIMACAFVMTFSLCIRYSNLWLDRWVDLNSNFEWHLFSIYRSCHCYCTRLRLFDRAYRAYTKVISIGFIDVPYTVILGMVILMHHSNPKRFSFY